MLIIYLILRLPISESLFNTSTLLLINSKCCYSYSVYIHTLLKPFITTGGIFIHSCIFNIYSSVIYCGVIGLLILIYSLSDFISEACPPPLLSSFLVVIVLLGVLPNGFFYDIFCFISSKIYYLY